MIIVPIGHERLIQRFPFVTVGLIVLNIVIFVATIPAVNRDEMEEMRLLENIQMIDPFYFNKGMGSNRAADEQIKELMKMYGHDEEAEAKKKKRLEAALKELEDFRKSTFYYKWGFEPADWNIIDMISYAFLHGGWLHVIGNMLFLWIFGTALEDRWGPFFFSGMYLIGAMAGALIHGIANLDLDIPLVGASGATFALCGAFMLRFHDTKVVIGWFIWVFFTPRWGRFKVAAWLVMLVYFLQNLFFLYIYSDSTSATGVAYGAHVGGFILGLGAAYAVQKLDMEEKQFKKYDLDGEEHIVPEEFQAACEQIGKGEMDAAMKNLLVVLEKEPGYLPAFTEIFKINLKNKDQGGAVEYARKVITELFRLNEDKLAFDNYYKLIDAFPDAILGAPMEFKIAVKMAEKTEYRQAATAYRKLAVNHPNTLLAQKALLTCGNLLTDKVGDHGTAMEIFQYLEQNYPDSEFIAYTRQGHDRAAKALQKGNG